MRPVKVRLLRSFRPKSPNQSLTIIPDHHPSKLARITDVPEILAMIRELADHEKLLNKCLATEASLFSTLSFADSTSPIPTGPGYAKTLILRAPASVVPGGFPHLEVAGMALYFNNYSTWRSAPGVYLEDLYVRPQFRKRGYGKLLIQVLAEEVRRIDGGRLEWCCLRSNEPSLQFYRSLGAVEQVNWVTLRVDGETLESMADEAGKGRSAGNGVAA